MDPISFLADPDTAVFLNTDMDLDQAAFFKDKCGSGSSFKKFVQQINL